MYKDKQPETNIVCSFMRIVTASPNEESKLQFEIIVKVFNYLCPVLQLRSWHLPDISDI